MTETLAPLLVKWLTHDFATPIATVMTASELLGDVADAEINGLVADAAKRLGGRLQLVRAAMAPGSGPMGAAGLEKLLRAGLHDTPVTLAIPADHVSDGARAAVIACAALLLSDLRRGQPLTIASARIDWATPAPFSDAVAAALAGAPATDSRSSVAAMLADAATRAGLALTVTQTGLAWA
jgi:hypothetical protein